MTSVIRGRIRANGVDVATWGRIIRPSRGRVGVMGRIIRQLQRGRRRLGRIIRPFLDVDATDRAVDPPETPLSEALFVGSTAHFVVCCPSGGRFTAHLGGVASCRGRSTAHVRGSAARKETSPRSPSTQPELDQLRAALAPRDAARSLLVAGHGDVVGAGQHLVGNAGHRLLEGLARASLPIEIGTQRAEVLARRGLVSERRRGPHQAKS